MKAYYLLLSVFLLVASNARGFGRPVPQGSTESGSVVASDENGAVRWRSRWTMRDESVNGEPRVRMTEEGQGLYSGFREVVQWKTESLWSRGDVFRPLESEKVFRDPDGTPLVRERAEFDFSSGVVRFEREDLETSESRTEVFDLPPDTIAVDGIAAAIREISFDTNPSVSAHLFTPEPAIYEVTLENRGRETLTTPSGELASYKIEIVPHLGIVSFFRFLLPKAYFWFGEEPPHPWIRYEGPENGRGTPWISMQSEDGQAGKPPAGPAAETARSGFDDEP